jgi:hypothetical protein
VDNCYSRGVLVLGHAFVGGLVGLNEYGTVEDCYSSEWAVVGSAYRIGGLVGHNAGTISRSYAEGLVSYGIDCNTYDVGGLVGRNTGNVDNSYATSQVEGYGNLGGLIGYNLGSVAKCYSMGFVDGIEQTGGLVGYGNPILVTNSFWDNQTSGQPTSPGGGTPKTTAQMKNINTYLAAGWNIVLKQNYTNQIWYINNDYPKLGWQWPA